jgi:hypothetical protein
MEDVQWQMFAYIVSQVETPLVTAVTDVSNSFLAYVAAPLKIALVLYVALTGFLIARGEAPAPMSVLLPRMLKMAIIVWLLTGSGIYQQWVYNFFFITLPTSLTEALIGRGRYGQRKQLRSRMDQGLARGSGSLEETKLARHWAADCGAAVLDGGNYLQRVLLRDLANFPRDACALHRARAADYSPCSIPRNARDF